MKTLIASGKDIKSVRFQRNLTQPQFAKWLSKESGEAVAPIDVCRMETFGKRDACHPISPSHSISEIILSQLQNTKKKLITSN